MSIKDTVQSMEQNLKAYYDALEEKGGTVPEERNMENLAGTAGEGTIAEDWADTWGYWEADRMLASDGSTVIQMPARVKMANSTQMGWLSSLGTTTSFPAVNAGGSLLAARVSPAELTKVIVGKQATSTTSGFIGSNQTTSNVSGAGSKLKLVDFGDVSSIGNGNLMSMRAFNGAVVFPKNQFTIGENFMHTCTAYSKILHIPSSCNGVGAQFLYNCNNISTLYIEQEAVPPTDNNSLSTTDVNASSYANGIVLTGPGAAAWKAALPDRTTSPYRKLIVATTLLDFKNSLDAGTAYTEFPVGSEIYDTYNGQSNPLIVVQYLDNTNNNEYGGAVGAIMMRKYAEPTGIVFDDTSNSYQSSSIKSFLEADYYGNCSDELKTVISDITIPVMNLDGSTTYLAQNKWFVMGAIEVCAFDELQGGSSRVEGINWEYWKNKIGSSGSMAANAGRIITDRDGNACYVWTRSKFTAANAHAVYGVMTTGAISQNFTVTTTDPAISVLPACFIAKD